MRIGYARVSTRDQNLQMQITTLQNSGCDKIITEKLRAVKHRPEFE
ncbi:MAG: recombinase family protein [Bacteroidetes bacterium]|nr:recombinase family protein [Bacteroidota bacterium]